MNNQARTTPIYIRLGLLLLAALLLFGLSPLALTARAAPDDGWKENIELTGNFTGTFTLDSSTSQIFRVDNAAPGDSWTGTITIRNKAGGPMEVALLSIASELEDLALYNALTLDIKVGNTTVYSGSYGATPVPVTPFYVVPAGTSMQLTATVAFPPHYGNEMMGKEMDSTWIFEARYLGDGPGPALYPYTVKYLDAETGAPLADDKTAYAPYGESVTEYALDIEGYTPDASEKSITIRAKNNLITFYYEKAELPSEPSTPPSDEPSAEPSDPGSQPSDDPSAEPSDPGSQPSNDPSTEPSDPGSPPSDKPVQTGNDLSESNTTPVIYIFLALLCAVAILIVFLRIRSAKRSREN